MNLHLRDYLNLTKPSIMLLVVVTGATSLIVEGSLLSDPFRFFLVLLGLYLTGGCANALNQYFERDVDAQMSRTSKRRPLPQGKLTPYQALTFSILIGTAGTLLFGFYFNWLTAGLALSTIIFYGFFYTLWLKPNTDQNIVIGGVAGAMAPVGAWTAATGSFSITPWILFAIIFFWTPPHFWSLAMFCKDDYVKVGYPMLPVAQGDAATLNQIFYYSLMLFAITMSLLTVEFGFLYLAVSLILGGLFVKKAFDVRNDSSPQRLRGLFGYSIVYLFALFITIAVEGII
ncbi:MAG: protoheme IX farnesyltransferase [Gemmatimonadetes bacterium]|nr:MAG: protoheme IX farnesyltransferase [Gemmatimonadota bacterium]